MKNKRKKKSDGKDWFGESFTYVKESSNYIWISVCIFLFGTALSLLFPGQFSFLDEMLKGIFGQVADLDHGELISFIFANNLKSSAYGLFFGALFGIFSIFGSLGNGIVLGYVLALVLPEAGLWVLLDLVPHGIFEFPAIFISFGLGIKLGAFILEKENKSEIFKERLIASGKAFLTIVVPLLIIAAIIEGSLIALL